MAVRRKKAAAKRKAPKKRAKQASRSCSDGPKMGRPTMFSRELADKICDRLAEGESLRRICLDDDMPVARTVRRWVLRQGIEGDDADYFSQNYEEARLAQADHYFEEIIDIPDDARNRDAAGVSAAKNRADSRKWVLARMNRVKFGDKSDLNIGGQENAPPVETKVDLTHVSKEKLAELRKLGREIMQGGTDAK